MVSLGQDGFPEIQLVSGQHGGVDECTALHTQLVRIALKKILPPQLFEEALEDEVDREDFRAQLEEHMPLVATSRIGEAPCTVTFYMVQKARRNAFRFFMEMLGQWLVPGRTLPVPAINAVDFRFPGLGDQVYTYSQVAVSVDDADTLEQIRQNIPILRTELQLGAESAYYARRILEIKGLSPDEKTAMIQEHVGALLRKRPDQFDHRLFADMQHLLVNCSDDFKKARECRHICRIIGMGHVLRKQVQEEQERDPTRRHLFAKVLRSRLHQGGGVRTVLGILVGVNFLKDNESLEERHILKAVQNYIPGAQVVEGSVVCSGTRGGDTSTLYVEIEKISGLDFTVEELHQLSKALPHDLRDRVEHMMHPIFMPRNEEEVMRNMLTLSNQIKYLRDIPQVMISFDEQTDTQLSFCVTMVRVLRQHSAPIPELIASTRCPVDFTCEASRVVGHVRRKYAKEATIIHVRLRKHRFLRRDNRIDLNKARQVVVEELEKVIGEFRDYNGGMISKQNELLCAVRDLLGDDLKHNDFLLENFFYSLNPVVMRTILEAEHLASLFKLLLRTLEDGFFDGGGSVMRSCALETAACAIVTADQPALRTALDRELKKINLRPLELATTFVNVYDTPRLGYILRSGDPARQRQFFEALELGVARFTGCVPAHSL